eukprot:342434-Prymnesium_polylepis.1
MLFFGALPTDEARRPAPSTSVATSLRRSMQTAVPAHRTLSGAETPARRSSFCLVSRLRQATAVPLRHPFASDPRPLLRLCRHPRRPPCPQPRPPRPHRPPRPRSPLPRLPPPPASAFRCALARPRRPRRPRHREASQTARPATAAVRGPRRTTVSVVPLHDAAGRRGPRLPEQQSPRCRIHRRRRVRRPCAPVLGP